MSKIPIKPILNTIKNFAPKAKDFVEKNPEKVLGTISVIGKIGKTGLIKSNLEMIDLREGL